MKKYLLLLLLAVFGLSFQSPVYAQEAEELEEFVEIEGIDYWVLNMNLLSGNKAFTSGSLWGDGHAKVTQAWDISIDMGRDSWPLRLLFGATRSASKKRVVVGGTNYRTEVSEVYAGVRKYLGKRALRLYFGAGVAGIGGLIETETTTSKTRYSETALGPFVNGGMLIDMSDTYHIGVDVRQIYGTKVTIDGKEGSLDYLQAGLLIGVHW